VAHAAEPLAEETLEGLSLARQIAAKNGPKRSVVLDAVIEPFDEHPYDGRATDARQEIAVDERPMSIRVSQKTVGAPFASQKG
jgi:hypothetical protein